MCANARGLGHAYARVSPCARAWACVCLCVCVCGCTSPGVFLCSCRLTYPVCLAPAPYFLPLLWLRNIFRHYLINGTIFGKKRSQYKIVFWFFLQILFGTFFILRINQRDAVTNVKTSSCKLPFIFRILMKIWFSRHVLKEVSNIKVHQNPFSGSRVIPCGQTNRQKDGRTDMTKLKVVVLNFANAPKNKICCRSLVFGNEVVKLIMFLNTSLFQSP